MGSPYILEGIGEDGEISAEAKAKVDSLLKTQFRPEFLNRLDEIIYYKPLMKDQVIKICDLMLDDLRKRLADRQVNVVVTERAKAAIADNGFDPNYGARPLKRYIQHHIETLLAKKIIGDDVAPNTTLTVDYENDAFTVK